MQALSVMLLCWHASPELSETLIWKVLDVKLILGQEAPFYFLSPEGPIAYLVSEQENVHYWKLCSA